MRMKIVLHGALRKLHTAETEIEGKTPLEALRTLFTQLKQFRGIPGKLGWQVKVVGFDSIEALMQPAKQRELHVVPTFCAGKENNGFLQVVVGAVLIVASFFFPPAAGIGGVTYASLAFSLGVSIAAGGLIQLISPAPRLDLNPGTQAGDPAASKYLGAPKNTVAIGTHIPVLYGEFQVFGHYLSFNIDAKRVSV
jgi:predicted phage tail protein